MAEVHDATLTPGKLELLQDWIPRQRWYAAKGRTPRLRRVWSWRLDDPAGEVGIETLLVVDESGTEPVLYQVPLTYRGAPLTGAEHALVGTMEHSVLGHRWVYDGPHDPVYAEQLLELAVGRAVPQAGGASDTAEPAVVGTRHPSWTARTSVRGARVLSGEQSNTSMIYDCVDESGSPRPLICKVFRTLQAGANPDVVVQGALVEAGSARVPGMVGSVAATWPSPTQGAPGAYGHLAFAQEFLPGTEDAWRVALRAVAAGESFARQAYELGEATAEVHAVLARALPTQPASEQAVAQAVAGMRLRYAAAASEVPAIAAYDHEISDVFERAAAAQWPALQRIHGDYHLGQVLHSPGRGWVLLDFEGEPLRPLAERSRADLAVRDIAGMLRSFDYAAGSWEQSHPEQSAREWVEQAQSAFLDGYAAAAGRDPRLDEALLVALQLDKALYEVVYEARNRPSWLSIPTDAVVRLLDQLKEGDTMTPNLPRPGDQERRPAAPAGASPATPDPTHAIDALAAGRHQQPHDLLGQHLEPGGLRVRAFRRFAHSVTARFEDGQRLPLQHEAHGVWSGVRTDTSRTMDYRLLVDYGDGAEHEHDDPYRFAPTLGDVDRHLIGEGRHEQLWTVLGAHVHEYDGPIGTVRGTAFAVWAPHARAVHVTGDFNGWDETSHPMRLLGESGVWELFVPGISEGTRYKFAIRGSDDEVRSKADPMAQATETPPATASVVTRSQYEWGDGEWLRRRAQSDAHTGPMSVYEVHLGSWRTGLGYRDLAEHLVNYVADLGFTHVELLPVMEHPYGPSWGYQVTGYFAPTARFGSPDEFRYLVDRLHQAGIGVILDWVPAHFPRDAWALAKFDGQALYEHPDPRRGDQPDWGTHIFDFGRIQVRNFLVANAIYWLEEFHIDGLRVDAVASMLYLDYSREEGQWLPNQYGGRENLEAIGLLQEANATTYKRVPGIVTVAEESTSWPGVTKPTDAGGLGFGLKWNMGWMNDTLRYLSQEPIHRQYHHNLLTFSLMYAYSENYLLPISHDEVVHGKGSLLRKIPGSRYDQLATLRAYFAYIWSHPGKQLIFMGSEFAQEAEWADGRELDWWLLDHAAHYRVHNLVKELNAVYRRTPALWALDSSPAGFEWLNANDNAGNTFSYLRFGGEDHRTAPVVAVVVNFSGTARDGLRIGLPRGGQWRVVLDTSGFDEFGTPSQADVVLTAQERPWDDQPYSAEVVVAKLSAIYLEPVETDRPAALSEGAGRG